jgi:rod shape-determining protein MreD
MKKSLYFTLTVILVLWVQIAGDYFFGSSGVSANIVLIAVLFFGLARGPLVGELMGFLWGLLMDASSLGLMGLHALLYASAGYLAGMLRRQLDQDKVWTQSIFTLIISVLYVVVYLILDRIFSLGPHPVSWAMGIQPISNAVIAPAVFWLLQRWTQLWDYLPQED